MITSRAWVAVALNVSAQAQTQSVLRVARETPSRILCSHFTRSFPIRDLGYLVDDRLFAVEDQFEWPVRLVYNNEKK